MFRRAAVGLAVGAYYDSYYPYDYGYDDYGYGYADGCTLVPLRFFDGYRYRVRYVNSCEYGY